MNAASVAHIDVPRTVVVLAFLRESIYRGRVSCRETVDAVVNDGLDVELAWWRYATIGHDS